MALRYCDGFEDYDDNHASEYWTLFSGVNIIQSGRGGSGGCLQSNGHGSGVIFPTGTLADYILGQAIEVPTFNGTFDGLLAFFNQASDVELSLGYNIAGIPYVNQHRTGQIWYASTPCIVANNYDYYEFQVHFDIAAGSFTLKRNGVVVLTQAGVQTLRNAGNPVQAYGLHWNTQGGTNIDDHYFCDTSGGVNNTFLGDVRVVSLRPKSNGRVNQWSPSAGSNWQNVKEAYSGGGAYPDDDTTYNEDGTVNHIDAYNIDLITGGPTIIGAMGRTSAKKTDAGNRSFAIGFGDGTGEVYDAGHTLGANYSGYIAPWDINPKTGVAWVTADLAAGTPQIAVKVLT